MKTQLCCVGSRSFLKTSVDCVLLQKLRGRRRKRSIGAHRTVREGKESARTSERPSKRVLAHRSRRIVRCRCYQVNPSQKKTIFYPKHALIASRMTFPSALEIPRVVQSQICSLGRVCFAKLRARQRREGNLGAGSACLFSGEDGGLDIAPFSRRFSCAF